MPAEAQIIVVSGLPGAGKSTTARELAARFERSAHVEADRLQDLIVAGAELPGLDTTGPPEEGTEVRRQLDLRLEHSCLLARSFVRAGFTAIVDDIVIGSAVADLRKHLAGVPFTFVMLLPEFATVRQRWLDMNSPFADRWGWIDDEIRSRTERLGLWLDTTTLDPAQTAEAILSELSAAR